jgi:hypothetical protein
VKTQNYFFDMLLIECLSLIKNKKNCKHVITQYQIPFILYNELYEIEVIRSEVSVESKLLLTFAVPNYDDYIDSNTIYDL